MGELCLDGRMDNRVEPLRIAVLQRASVRGNIEANLAELDRAASQAQRDGVNLLITPEMYVTGYNIGDVVAQLALDQPLERVAEIAVRHGIAILAGGPERLDAHAESETPAIANSAWFINEHGEVLARHRKLQLFGDVDRTYFVAGTAPVTMVNYRGVNIAILICFDVEYPEAVRAAAFAGADLMAVPTAQMEPFGFVNEHVIRVRAWDNAVYVAYANQTGPDGDFDYVGLSVISSPFGENLVQAGRTEDALITAVVDPEVLTAARAQNTYLAEVRRDLFASDGADRS